MTTSDKQQTSRALDTLGNLRQALRRQMEARSDKGWTGSFRERMQLASAARKSRRALFEEGWDNPGAALDQSAGHLKGHVDVWADVYNKPTSEFASITLDKIEDLEQVLQSRLDGSPLMFPITASALTRLAGLKNVPSVTGQIDLAINKDCKKHGKAQLKRRMRGEVAKYSEADLRRAHAHFRNGSDLKEFLASALEIK